MNLIDRIEQHEGFEEKPYQDHLGNWTFGHGLTYITEAESRWIVAGRIEKNRKSLMTIHPWLQDRPQELIDVLVEMSFQMGIAGVNRFVNTLAAMQSKRYGVAADEMMDSKWAEQTPGRASKLSEIVRSLSRSFVS